MILSCFGQLARNLFLPAQQDRAAHQRAKVAAKSRNNDVRTCYNTCVAQAEPSYGEAIASGMMTLTSLASGV